VTLKRLPSRAIARVPSGRPRAVFKSADAEVMLWTTRDGREIPLEDMTDAHIQNAIFALSRWRSRIRREPGGEATLRHIADALARFKRTLRRRAKASSVEVASGSSKKMR
jgi:hypothetical protein